MIFMLHIKIYCVYTSIYIYCVYTSLSPYFLLDVRPGVGEGTVIWELEHLDIMDIYRYLYISMDIHAMLRY